MRRLTFAIVLALGCQKPSPAVPAILDAGAPTIASATPDAEPIAEPIVDAGVIARMDAGPLRESLDGFEGAKLVALPIELLPTDQRKRDDKKSGPVRIATVNGSGLAVFGLETATVAEGPVTRAWFDRSKRPEAGWEEMVDRWGPDPKPSLLVVEDAARSPIAVRFVGVPLEVKETKIAGGPAFLVRTLRGPSGIDDPVDLDVIALRSGELVVLLHAYLGFRDIEPCSDGKRMSTLGPPGSVTVLPDGNLHVRDAKDDCDSPGKVVLGCKGSERDYTWDVAKGALVPGTAKPIAYTTTRTACP